MVDVPSPGLRAGLYRPKKRSLHRFINHLFIPTPPLYIDALHPKSIVALDHIQRDFPDVSFWQGPINFSKMKTMTDAVIIRMGQRAWTDTAFDFNYLTAKLAGLLRGAYWFYDGRNGPLAQADIISKLFDKFGLPEMEFWMDWERNFGGSYEGLRNVVACMQVLEQRFPDLKVGMYSGYYFILENSNIIINFSQYQYLKSRPFWLGQYGVSTSLIRVPYPWTAKTVRHHQYGTPVLGHIMGVQSLEIDMNRFADPVYSWYELYRPVFTIAEYQKVRRFDSDCYVLYIDPAQRVISVTDTKGQLETVRSVAQKAKYAINADMWNKSAVFPHVPDSLATHDGNRYQAVQKEARPFLNVLKSGIASIRHKDVIDFYNTASGVRYLVLDGARAPYLLDPLRTDYNQDRSPRTACGIRADGKVIFIVVDGRSNINAGVTFLQLADLLLEFGCTTGFDFDGGGSSTLVKDGQVINVPMDIDRVSRERAVVNHILIGIGDPMPTYTVTINSDMSLRENHAVSATKLEVISFGADVKADGLWTAPADGTNVKADDQWAHVVSVDGILKDAWVAIKHMGAIYGTADAIPPVVIPPAPQPTDTATLVVDLQVVSGKLVGSVRGVAKGVPFNIEYG